MKPNSPTPPEGHMKTLQLHTVLNQNELYRTARATISCAHFKKGDIVSVKYDGKNDGIDWFNIEASENGPLPHIVCYPKHHLTDFSV
jgi:hypothetical protein